MSPCVKQPGTCSFSCCLFVDAIMACLWRRLIRVRQQDGMAGISIIHAFIILQRILEQHCVVCTKTMFTMEN